MYPFVTHTWNTIKGKCPHDCSYCYMKRFGEQKPVRFDDKELIVGFGERKFIFVGSSCDMWADKVPKEWILDTIAHCRKYPYNKYLFQSKNPSRMIDFRDYIPKNSILGTTIETNRDYPQMGKSQKPMQRADAMHVLSIDFKTMVTIEPIMDFSDIHLISLILKCNPEWVNIGADSQKSGLPEPSADKINELINNLKAAGLEVKIKDNLKRLMK